MAASAPEHPRYEADENPPLLSSVGYGLQFSLIASATLLVTPVIVANAADRGGSYVTWMVFASLVVVGLSTIIQVRKLGFVGAGAVLPMFTAAFAIPFCITALVDGGPATLTTLVILSAIVQLVMSRWLFILRRFVTPTVGGTVMMILSITLASVVFDLLDEATSADPEEASITALVTMVVAAALMLRGSAFLRFWGPLAGIVVGCIVAGALGIFDTGRITAANWIGVPAESPGLALDFGVDFWTLVPAFLFLGVIISIQANGAAIAMQRVAWRDNRAVSFRQVQGAVAGAGASNFLAGLAGTVPNAINPAMVSFTLITGVAARRVGYLIGAILIIVAFLPKVSAVLSSIPGPVMTGYLIMVTGALFVDGARTVIQNEQSQEKIAVAGVCFWIAASFQFELFHLPDIGGVGNALLKSGITTGGLAAIVMILYLELTNPRRMRFKSQLNADVLPELNEFITRFAQRRGWESAMQDRLSAVAEETLLTLAPLDLSLGGDDEEQPKDERQLVVLASSEGTTADLEFIGGGAGANLEDQIRQVQEHDSLAAVEEELSLVLLRSYAESVTHQQYHDTDIITVRVVPPGSG
jgi:xanthine/uracil permease